MLREATSTIHHTVAFEGHGINYPEGHMVRTWTREVLEKTSGLQAPQINTNIEECIR
jgi:hypothetical protein